MAHFRQLLVVSLIAVTSIAAVFFSYPFVDLVSKPKLLVYESPVSDRIDGNRRQNQIIPIDDRGQGKRPTVSDPLVVQNTRKGAASNQNVAVWGRVETEFGETIAGETVVFYSPSLKAHYSMRTGDYGEYEFADLRPAWDYVVKVSPRGMYKRYTRSSLNLSSDQEVYNIVLESIPVGVLTGRVVDSYDRPVMGVELSIQTMEKDSWSTNVVTDATGAFSVAAFPKGRFQVAVVAQQFKATGFNFDPDVGEPVSLTIDLGPYSLGGRIYDESGRAFDGANVFVIWALQNNGIKSRSTRQVSADATGSFRFSGLGPGDHELIVTAWKDGTFKQTTKQIVNVGIDPGELNIFLSSL